MPSPQTVDRGRPVTIRPEEGGTSSLPIDQDRFMRALAEIPEGHSAGQFRGTRWAATKKLSEDGRRIWLFGEEQGSVGIVSFNAYRLSDGRLVVRPCEMSIREVTDFVLDYTVERAPGRGDRPDR
jgi:hypothetical protein